MLCLCLKREQQSFWLVQLPSLSLSLLWTFPDRNSLQQENLQGVLEFPEHHFCSPDLIHSWLIVLVWRLLILRETLLDEIVSILTLKLKDTKKWFSRMRKGGFYIPSVVVRPELWQMARAKWFCVETLACGSWDAIWWIGYSCLFNFMLKKIHVAAAMNAPGRMPPCRTPPVCSECVKSLHWLNGQFA